MPIANFLVFPDDREKLQVPDERVRCSNSGFLGLRQKAHRRVGPERAAHLGLRAQVERTGAENASTRIHLGVSVSRRTSPASVIRKQRSARVWIRQTYVCPRREATVRAAGPTYLVGH